MSRGDEYTARTDLNTSGVPVRQPDTVKPNHGSETARHFVAKELVGHYYIQQGRRIDSEVEFPDGSVADIVAYAGGKRPVVVELETSPTRERTLDKVDAFTAPDPVRECFVLNLNDCPEHILDAYAWVNNQL